jgi:hypothetical protein
MLQHRGLPALQELADSLCAAFPKLDDPQRRLALIAQVLVSMIPGTIVNVSQSVRRIGHSEADSFPSHAMGPPPSRKQAYTPYPGTGSRPSCWGAITPEKAIDEVGYR